MQIKIIVKYALVTALSLFALSGCVAEKVISQVPERQGTRAYVKKEYPEAAQKYEQAIGMGNANAMYYLAVMYLEGEGVPKDAARTVELLEKACEQEQKDALLMLGLFYVYGDNVEKDPEKGAQLIYRAGVARNDVAMYYMGHLYAAGLGVDKDIKHAQMWMYNAKRFDFPVPDKLLTKQGLENLYPN